ncbi:MAG: hypothetical protein KKH04_17890 [Proteobacteria bacterium]|nr:hypothetical protein [Pseudomonadota bacterium]
MGKEPKEFDRPDFNYGINNCYDLFVKLNYDGEKVAEEWHQYDCFNFFITAWHLWDDWIPKDINRPKLSLEKIGRTPENMRNLMLSLKNLTDGSKHMVLKKRKLKNKKITNVQSRIIGDWRAYFFNEPQIYISIGNAHYSMWDIRYLITHYFSWLFDDSVPSREFPELIKEHLERCIIK